MKKYRSDNAEKIRVQQRAYWRKNREKMRGKNRRKYRKHGERLRERTRAYYRQNKDKCLDIKTRARIDAIKKLGPACVTCGYDKDIRAIQIDHIKNDGVDDRRERGNYAIFKGIQIHGGQGRYQVLCANCNWIKQVEFKKKSRRA